MRQKTDKKQFVDIVEVSCICRKLDFISLEFDINFSSKLMRREIQTYLETLKTFVNKTASQSFNFASGQDDLTIIAYVLCDFTAISWF